MIDYLMSVEKRLGKLVHPDEECNWQSMLVTYEHPHVERLWRQDGENRIYLHRIHPCTAEQAFYHTHPWPSAMLILSGKYKMNVGIGPIDTAEMILTAGSRYSMTNPQAMHSVQPLETPTLSLMVTGPRWEIDTDQSIKHFHSKLTANERKRLFDDVWRAYMDIEE